MEMSSMYNSDDELSPLCQALLLSPSPGKNAGKRKLGDRTQVQRSFDGSPGNGDLVHSPGSVRDRKTVSSGEKVETKRAKLDLPEC
jgi:hypothetical protein